MRNNDISPPAAAHQDFLPRPQDSCHLEDGGLMRGWDPRGGVSGFIPRDAKRSDRGIDAKTK